MVRTGGTLSAKMIELIGDLNEQKTLSNINKALRNIEKNLNNKDNKIKLNVELFARIEDMRKDVSAIQNKIKSNSSIKDIKLGVGLEDITIKDINEQVAKAQARFSEGKSSNTLKLDIEFDFKGSASRIKEEMDGIKQFMQRYGDQMNNMEPVSLGKSEEGVRKSVEGIKSSVQELNKGTENIGNQMESEMRKMTDSTGKFSVNFKRDVSGAVQGATASLKSADGTVEKFKYSLDETGKNLLIVSRDTKIAGDATERYAKQVATVEDAQNKLNNAVKNAPENFTSKAFSESQADIDRARNSLEQYGKATDVADQAMSSFSNNLKITKKDLKFQEAVNETKNLADEFKRLGGSDEELRRITKEIQRLSQDGSSSFDKLQSEIKESISEFQRLDKQMSETSRKEFRTAIQEQDIATVKRYIEEMKGASVASLRLSDAKDKEGNAISRVKVNMEAQNGAVKSSTIEYDKATGKVRELDKQTKTLSESNKSLDGSFSGILSRITQYFSAITLLQKGMQTIKKTISEILDIDAQMIELARVADPSLNLDVMLERSVALSKELGASVSDVVGVVGDMARTFGEFNEEQILAITRTATIMQNVSELNLEQASSTLVGTMKAFNIQAEDSIHIVNSFNEVDNNFAISTDQIAQSMERAGATAQTFGVDMEHLIGDITAVGEVTQESGQRIGTALRTIYSRVTTHKDSIATLNQLGISMREMGDSGPELRSVSDILGDLGKIWGDLNHEQQQNAALDMAGRNRLTQFLALMNNQATAVEATTTAYNSQGSAMREQKEYMGSYEYQMTVLGATATDVALTIEDKFVGDAMYLVVSAGTDMLDTLDNIIDKVGFLPVVFGGATAATLIFSKSVRGLAVKGTIEALGKFLSMGMDMGPVISSVSGKLLGMATSAGIAGKAFSLMTGGLIIGGFIALGIAIEKIVSKMAEVKRANEEAQYAMEEAISAYNMHGNEVDSLIDKYEKLHQARQKGELDPEAEREYLDLVNQISTMLPNAVSHVDAQGQAHLRSADAIRKQSGAMRDLSKSSAEAMRGANEETFTELVDNLASAQERQKKASEEAEKSYSQSQISYEEYRNNAEMMNEAMNTNTVMMSEEAFERSVLADATEKYYKQSSLANANAFEQSSLIQEATVLIGDQTVAYMNADGQMQNVSTTAQALIRDYAAMNSQVLENAEGTQEISDATEKLTKDSEQFGKIMVGVYNDIASGLNDVDAEKAIDQFDQLVQALPEEEFTKSFDVIEQNMGSLQSIIGDVAAGAEIDIDGLVKMLESTGMESDTARSYVIALGEAFENQQIRNAVAKETLTEYNDELVRTKESALEAFNPLEALFGFDSDNLKGMESHLTLLRLMKNQYGETWSEMDRGQLSIQALSDFFNTSTDIVVDNFDLLEEVTRGLSTTTSEYSKEAKKEVLVFDENISKTARAFITKMLEMGDEFPGFTDSMIIEMGVLEKSQEEMVKKTEEMNNKFKALFESPGDIDAKNNLLNHLREDLEDMRGSISYAEDDFGNFKLLMADGTRSEYLDSINNQLEDNNLKLEVYQDREGEWLVGISNDVNETIDDIASLSDVAVRGSFAINAQREAVKALISESTSNEDRESFLEVFNDQLSAFGEGLDIVGNKTDGFKINLEGNEHNPWLVALNGLVEDLGLKIDQTKNDAGELEIAFQTKDGETFFTTAKGEVEELDEKIKEVDESAEKLANPGKERNVKIGFDGEEVNIGMEHVDNTLDAVFGDSRVMELKGDNTGIHAAVDDSNEKTKELEDKAVKLEIDADSLKTHNDIRKEIYDTKMEILDLETALDGIKKDLTVTNESMQNLMTNTSNINNAHSAIKNLNEMVDISVDKMGDLYAMFSSESGIDTTGIEASTQKIESEVGNIEMALASMQDYITSMNLSLRSMDASFDTTPITNYSSAVLDSASLIASDISNLSLIVSNQMESVSSAFEQGNISLSQVQIQTSNILGQVVVLHRLTGEMISSYSLKASTDMINNYNQGLIGILQATSTFRGLMDNHFNQFYSSMVQRVTMTVVDMRTKFTNGTNDIVRVAEGLPGRIGQGIRNNISQATSSMTALASNMVTRFKRELGIHSPSRVFTELGGHVIDGLVNGLTGSDITNLGQTVFSDFSDGAISTINEIKGYMTFEPVTAGSFGAGFTKTSGFGPRKSPGGIGSRNHKGVDFAAPTGTPIPSQSSGVVTGSGYHGTMGNYVKVRSGDGKEHIYMHQSKRNVGVGQKVGRGQIIGHVGSTGNSTGPHVHYEIRVNGVPIDPTKRFRGFAEGGFVDKKELAWHGEEGLEAIIPLIPQRRERGLDLWRQSGEILGMNSELLKMLMGTRRKSSEYGGRTGFAGLDGDSGEGSSASGTSGVMQTSVFDIVDAMGVKHEPMFTSMAKEEREDLYKRDYHAINNAWYEDLVRKANIQLSALTEQTLEYRKALDLLTKQEQKLEKHTRKSLSTTVRRQETIKHQLKSLKNTSKHTVKQRKRYNELQEEYDKNSESIMNMTNKIEELNIAMDERKLQRYTDYIGEMSEKYLYMAGSIERTISQSEFYLKRVELLSAEDINRQLKIKNDILNESIDLEEKLVLQQSIMRREYKKSMDKYGSRSKEALVAREKMIEAEDRYRQSVIDRIEKEKELYEIRRNEIATQHEYMQGSIGRTIAQSEFNLRKAELIDSDNINAQLKIKNEILRESRSLEEKLEQQQVTMRAEYQKAMSQYGSRSEQALKVRESMLKVEDEYRSATIDRMEKEKEIEEIRKNVAQESTQAVKEYYEQRQAIAEKAIEIERKSLEKAHKENMSRYDDEISKIESVYDAKIRELDDKKSEDSYQKEITDLSSRRSDLNAEISRASRDTSLEGRKRLSELREELKSVNEDIKGAQEQRQDELYRRAIEQQRKEQVDKLEMEKKAVESSYDARMESLEKQVEDSKKKMETIVNDDKFWDDIVKNFTSGNTVELDKMIKEMEEQMYQFLVGDFGEIGSGLTKEELDTLDGDVLIDISNSMLKLEDILRRYASTQKSPNRNPIGEFDIPVTPHKLPNAGLTRPKGDPFDMEMMKNALDTRNLINKVKGVIPKIRIDLPNVGDRLDRSKGDEYHLDKLILSVEGFEGTQEDVQGLFDNLAKELKKKGSR